MVNNKKITVLLAFTMALVIMIQLPSCKNDPPDGIDKVLYDMGRKSDGFTWYKNSSAQLDNSDLSGHAEPKQRTRYNAIAATALDSNYKIIEGTIFPEGSLVVKELYKANGDLSSLAMLYKKQSQAEADADGWVWGYFEDNGDIRSAASEKGSSCRGCHSQSGAIDFNLMNVSHP
jgi:hypothetical protein